MYHAVRLSVGNKLFFAPLVTEPTCVLDIGTGTGKFDLFQPCLDPLADEQGCGPLNWVSPSFRTGLRCHVSDAKHCLSGRISRRTR